MYRPQGGISALVRGLGVAGRARRRHAVVRPRGRAHHRVGRDGATGRRGRRRAARGRRGRVSTATWVRWGPACSDAARARPLRARPAASVSLSALTWTLSARRVGPGAASSQRVLHRPPTIASEFEAIFGRDDVSQRPTVYICAQDRDDSTADAVRPRAHAGGRQRPRPTGMNRAAGVPPRGNDALSR